MSSIMYMVGWSRPENHSQYKKCPFGILDMGDRGHIGFVTPSLEKALARTKENLVDYSHDRYFILTVDVETCKVLDIKSAPEVKELM